MSVQSSGRRARRPGVRRVFLAGTTIAAMFLTACASSADDDSTSSTDSPSTDPSSTSAPDSIPVADSTSAPDASAPSSDPSQPADSSDCPYAVDFSAADFYPMQPSFSAGYTVSAQLLNDDTADWAYVVEAEFPYSNWMAWYLYDLNGVPVFKFSDSELQPDDGSTNPFVQGNPVLASPRTFHLYLMPSTTPSTVVSDMETAGKNVALLPAQADARGVSIVFRSYWSFSNDGLGDYDRMGFGGPTATPYPLISAFLTDSSTGELTDNRVDDCSAQSPLPEAIWYDRQTKSPIVTFEDAPVPTEQEIGDLPKWALNTGSVSGKLGQEFPPSPVANEVQFYRNNASTSPYADVQSAPPPGSPPDACGGYVMANLPNDLVSLVHVPKVPSFPDYSGATTDTANDSDDYEVRFYSMAIYGATKQADAYGTLQNSQLGNRQLAQNDDGSATIVLYPQSATTDQIDEIAAIVEANGWNLLRSGVQSALAPNLLVIREKGQSENWTSALSTNDVTDGAPCPQSDDPTLPLPQDPPSAQVTQSNGMGLTAPAGENCTVDAFLTGKCLEDLQARLQESGQVWSADGGWPTQQMP